MDKFLKVLVEDSVNDMPTLYLFFVSLISYDNNRTKEEIKSNCEILSQLIDVLSNYQDNKKLQDIRDKAIKYNEKYLVEV
jgi:hypothetical protein